ncbi:hypothetical protein [uncultured Polaribacter sp.]|uniref:hypothetical protein n=1 Tax=uncultured Polaribacter sp. TaxID=174711 RepID=UPI0026141DAF|nr:hypothetical protein [uncultured Polaribacter sp.]
MNNSKLLKSIIFFTVFGVLLLGCSPNDATDPNDPIFDDIDDEVIVGGELEFDVELSVDASDGVDINPDIFGVNNDWRRVPDNTFSTFANTLDDMGLSAKVFRYPGGWESEFYAWTSNTTPNWPSAPSVPGASVSSLKEEFTNYSIVIPTVDAMNRTVGSSQWNSAISKLKVTAENAITASGIANVSNGIVEIGNEWWLQFAGGSSRSQKLNKYVSIAMELAEHIDEKFPNHKFKLLINGDYTVPEEFTTMKQRFTKAYDVIDGVALHTYTGYTTDTHNIADLEKRIIDCANNFNPNKNFKYLSEWMPSRDYNERALYMEAANIIPDIIHIYARTGSEAAAYWPPVNTPVPGLGLTNWNFSKIFPAGQIMGDMGKSYRGKALKTTSNRFHIAAALQDENTMVLYITGAKETGKKVGVKVDGFIISSIESVERFVPFDYNESNKAEAYIEQTATAKLSSNNEVVFDINKEGLYQIYKIIVKGNN